MSSRRTEALAPGEVAASFLAESKPQARGSVEQENENPHISSMLLRRRVSLPPSCWPSERHKSSP